MNAKGRTPDALAPGTIIAGKYELGRLIGKGGMGTVLEARHLALGQRVALKVLDARRKSPDALARFLREARIAATLPPDHVVRVTDVGQTPDGLAYLVMELLVGKDLAQELARRRRLPIEEAVDLLLQATIGVADAHAAGLVHRDLKPSNLFLTHPRGGGTHVKVLDFGLSKVSSADQARITNTRSKIGTPQYMAPEQIASPRDVDGRCDQHALAAILYELITGRRAFDGGSFADVAAMVLEGPRPSAAAARQDVPPALDAAISKGMARKRDRRFKDLAEFAAAIAPFGGASASTRLAAVREALSPSAAHAEPSGDVGGLPYLGHSLDDEESSALQRQVAPTPGSSRDSTRKMKAATAAVGDEIDDDEPTRQLDQTGRRRPSELVDSDTATLQAKRPSAVAALPPRAWAKTDPMPRAAHPVAKAARAAPARVEISVKPRTERKPARPAKPRRSSAPTIALGLVALAAIVMAVLFALRR